MSKSQVGNSIVRSHRSFPSSRIADKSDSPILSRAIKGAFWGLCGALAIGIAMISIFAAIANSRPDPMALVPYCSTGSLMIGMLVGGFICIKKVKEAPLLCGIVTGAMSSLAFLCISLFLKGIPSSGNSFLGNIIIHASALLFSILGSYVGNVKRRNGKRRFG